MNYSGGSLMNRNHKAMKIYLVCVVENEDKFRVIKTFFKKREALRFSRDSLLNSFILTGEL